MPILIDKNTRVLCQGMTGWAGTYHANRMMEYGTNVVAAVTPGKGGSAHIGVPVFNKVVDAVAATKANASILFVPPEHAADAMIEAIEAELPLIVTVTERIPVLDMVRVREALAGSKTRLIGPNSQGILSPGICQIGVMATDHALPGPIGLVSRSASLTSEVVSQLSAAGLGQSTTVGIGGDAVHGVGFVECVKLFFEDPLTEGIVMIGEIGGSEEEEAAEYLRSAGIRKPVAALIVGVHAPVARRMGHAGTLAMSGAGDATSKISALRNAGVVIVEGAHAVGTTMRKLLQASAA
jgi:succinyl-CoA synthetase alpha subunit